MLACSLEREWTLSDEPVSKNDFTPRKQKWILRLREKGHAEALCQAARAMEEEIREAKAMAEARKSARERAAAVEEPDAVATAFKAAREADEEAARAEAKWKASAPGPPWTTESSGIDAREAVQIASETRQKAREAAATAARVLSSHLAGNEEARKDAKRNARKAADEKLKARPASASAMRAQLAEQKAKDARVETDARAFAEAEAKAKALRVIDAWSQPRQGVCAEATDWVLAARAAQMAEAEARVADAAKDVAETAMSTAMSFCSYHERLKGAKPDQTSVAHPMKWHAASAYAYYNNRSYATRGWPTFESACAQSVEEATAAMPARLRGSGDKLTRLNGDGDAQKPRRSCFRVLCLRR